MLLSAVGQDHGEFCGNMDVSFKMKLTKPGIQTK